MTCALCDKPVKATGLCSMHYERKRKHGDPAVVLVAAGHLSGEGARHWQGDQITYGSTHSRVRRARGPAKLHICHCGKPATDWAYDYNDPNEQYNDSGSCRYSPDIRHYVPMCRPCHRQFDKRNRAQ